MDTAASDKPCADEFEARLGRLRCATTVLVKSASIEPAPIDLRGPLRGPLAGPLPDTGGYWFGRRFRIARGAAGGSMAPDAPDAVEETLLCLVDVLCRRTIDPERTGRGPTEALAAAVAPRPSFIEVSIAATDRLSVAILLVLPGTGNWL